MTAFNVVRFRVKPGNEQRFIDMHREMQARFKGFIAGNLIRTGDRTFCMVGEWRNFPSIVAARPGMTALLDRFRDLLDDLGEGLGATDPVSGDVVVKFGPPKAAKKRAGSKAAKRKPAKRAPAKRAPAKRKPAKRSGKR
jgi:hypothetical protein